jgi:hypothetical protein
MSRWRGLPLYLLVAATTTIASCKDVPPPTVLQPQDVAPPSEGETANPFDPNTILDDGSFVDTDSPEVQPDKIQGFLAKTPYSHSSFLETYQSNGVRASDAIIAAARQYRINPLVFLVFTEITEGLIGARTYRFPPERVEYIFRCGCYGPDQCLPELAGYDRQVACLGQALRGALDDITVNNQTASGWGPQKPSTTLDHKAITPATNATAAIYDRIPRVNQGHDSGTWSFWMVWQLYSTTLGYSGARTSSDGKWIGEACTANAVCSAVANGICADHYPGGLCTVQCTDKCPTDPNKAATFCTKFPDGGYCLPKCNPNAAACREGYHCTKVAGAAGDSDYVCAPNG